MLPRVAIRFTLGINVGSHWLASGAIAFTLAYPTLAQAEPGVAVRAELEAPAECPDADWFLQEILKRAPEARPAMAAEAARRFRARVSRQGAGFSGVLESESLARTDARAVQAPGCQEVVSSLAMTVALSLEADPVEPNEQDQAPEADEPAVAAPIAPEPEAPKPDPVKPPMLPPARQSSLLGVGVEAGILVGGLPLLVGGKAAVLWRAAKPGAWAPMVRVGAGYYTRLDTGDTKLSLPLATVDLCPSLAAVGPIWLTPCVHSVLGLLRGEARESGGAEPASLLLGGTGIEGRLEWLLEPVLLDLHGGVLGVWSAPTFRARPSGRVLLEVERLVFDTGLGLSLVF